MAGTPVEKKLDLKYIIWVCIGLVLMFFGGKIIPTWGTVTELGVNMICVFVALLVLITVTNETIWPSLAALVATIFHGYMDAATAAANYAADDRHHRHLLGAA